MPPTVNRQPYLIQTISDLFLFSIYAQPIRYIALDSDRFDAIDRNSNFAILYVVRSIV